LRKKDEVEYLNVRFILLALLQIRAAYVLFHLISLFLDKVKLAEIERARSELQEKVTKLSSESENITQQLEDAELKASAAIKSCSNMESQLTETQQLLEEETRQKLGLSSKLRQLESEKEALQEQLEEDEEAKKSYEKKLADLNVQMMELKKKAEEEGLKKIINKNKLNVNYN
jgi:myosin protein heavy chain